MSPITTKPYHFTMIALLVILWGGVSAHSSTDSSTTGMSNPTSVSTDSSTTGMSNPTSGSTGSSPTGTSDTTSGSTGSLPIGTSDPTTNISSSETNSTVGSSSATSRSTATTVASPTPGSPVEPERKPIFDNADVNMTFTFSVNGNFNQSLGMKESQFYKDFASAVVTTVNAAFKNVTAYKECIVNEFRNGSIRVNYTLLFYAEHVLGEQQKKAFLTEIEEAGNYLDGTNFTVGGQLYNVNNSLFQKLLEDQMANLDATNVCSWYRATICPPCYTCEAADNDIGLTCKGTCLPDDHKFCIVIDNSDADEPWETRCRCDFNYLAFGSDCVHENVIIGVCVGVGGAIIVALIVTIVILAVRRQSSKAHASSLLGNVDGTSSSSHYAEVENKYNEYDNTGYSDEALESISNVPEAVQQNPDFLNFQPQLQNVNTETSFVIRRPKVSTSSKTEESADRFGNFF